MVGTDDFAKTICSICYEDLKPIVEDLQSISICGHVFHELCLQQWFEYSKKPTCPVCKQGCTKKNVGRLYFQSVGDPALSQSQNPRFSNPDEDSPEILRREVRRLENKVSGFVTALDQHQKEVQQLSNELQICKEQLSKEVILKNEALRDKRSIEAVLQTKSSELGKSTLQCSNLQERNLALAQELAALKLVSDCNLEEEEIVKLASFGNNGNNQDTIDVLKRSLVIRNKSYKELMAKCNSLGRGEARYMRKLEKSKEKIIKLKTRVQELELAMEAKENEVLRALKASKKRTSTDATMPTADKSTNPSSAFHHSPAEQKAQITPQSVINLDEDDNDKSFEVKQTKANDVSFNKFEAVEKSFQHKEASHNEQQKPKAADTSSKVDKIKEGSHQKGGSSRPSDFDQVGLKGLDGLRSDVGNECSVTKEAAGLLLQDIRQVQPSLNTRAETSSPIPLAEPGDRCFAGGLLGPDGANTYLGKWCKRVQNKASVVSSPGSNNVADSLITVGADGRGGRVKVLRSTMEASESNVPTKRFKTAPKSSSCHSQGCLQIEHFFGKARN